MLHEYADSSDRVVEVQSYLTAPAASKAGNAVLTSTATAHDVEAGIDWQGEGGLPAWPCEAITGFTARQPNTARNGRRGPLRAGPPLPLKFNQPTCSLGHPPAPSSVCCIKAWRPPSRLPCFLPIFLLDQTDCDTPRSVLLLLLWFFVVSRDIHYIHLALYLA